MVRFFKIHFLDFSGEFIDFPAESIDFSTESIDFSTEFVNYHRELPMSRSVFAVSVWIPLSISAETFVLTRHLRFTNESINA